MAPRSLHDLLRRIRQAIACLTTPCGSDDPFRSLAENSSDPIARLDSEGRYLYANPAHCALAGLEVSRIIGRNCHEIGAPKHAADLFQENVQKVVQGGNERCFEIALPDPDGSRWFEARFMPETGTDGKISSVLSVLREITERRQLEQQQADMERRQRALLDGIAERAWLKDLSGRYLAVNRQFAELTGNSPEKMIGKTAWDILPAEVAAKVEAEDQAVIERGQPLSVTRPSVLDKNQTWRETIKVPLRNSSGRVIGLICSSRDVTQHRQAQEHLEKSEQRLQLALRAAKSGVWECWPGTPESYWSEEAYVVIGLDPGKIRPTPENWLAQIHPEDRKRVREAFELSVKTESEYRADYRVLSKDGSIRWVSDVGCVCGDGSDRRMIGINTDVTERKLLEKKQRELELVQLALLDGIPDAIWLKDLTGRYLTVNREFERRLGIPKEKIVGGRAGNFHEGAAASMFTDEDHRVIREGRPLRVDRPAPINNRTIWAEIIKVPIKDDDGQVIGIAGVSRDVSERRSIEKALQESNEMLHAILGASPYAIIACNPSLEVMFWNPAAERLFGWKAAEVIGRKPPTSHHSDLQALERSMQHHEILANIETVWQKRDGSPVEILLSGAALRDSTRQMAGSVAICVDVTERNREQRALMASEEQFRLLAEDAQAVFWIGDRRFSRIDYISPGFDELWGMPREAVYRDPKTWLRHVHADDHPAAESFLRSQSQGVPAAMEVRLSLPDGTERWIRARSFPHNSPRLGDCVTGIVNDITDVKAKAADRLARVERQRDALVREVHHRIKNHLQGVAGLLRTHEAETFADKKILERAIAQIRSVAIIHGLQGLKAGSEVILCEMVPAIVQMMEGFSKIKTEVSTEALVDRPVRIAEVETVPIALIITELISNAIKHNDPPDAPVRVIVTTTQDSAKVLVINRGRLVRVPETSSAGSAGLDLVKALMPPHGASFSLDNSREGVEARLLLHHPTVTSVAPPDPPEPGN